MKRKVLALLLLLAMALTLLSGCGRTAPSAQTETPAPTETPAETEAPKPTQEPAQPEKPAEERDLLILYTSDVHCGVDKGWGYAGLAAAKEQLSKEYNVLLVDDGDAIQGEPVGTMTKGDAIIDIMNTVGYDAFLPGNHEFDYGVDHLLTLLKKANFPVICCNFNKEGELLFDPWLIREIGGVKVGFVGVVTPDTLRGSSPKNFQDENGNFIYSFMEDKTGERLYETVQKNVDEVRAAGADYVVLLAHLGKNETSSPWMYSEVIANTTGIDALLDGHSHDTDQVVMKDKAGHDVVRSACGTKMANIGVLHITRDGEISSELYSWGSSVAAPELLGIENSVRDAVAAATDELNAKLSEVVATTSIDLIINEPGRTLDDGRPLRIIRKTETNLGDLCADAFLDQAPDPDFAFINGGAIRVSIDKGSITLNDILTVFPFGNNLTVLEVSGQQVLDALEWSVHSAPGEFGGFLQVAGLRFEYDPTIPSPCVQDEQGFFDHIDGSMPRRVRNVVIGDDPLDPAKTYRLAGHNFMLLEGGDGYSMFKDCKVLETRGKLDNQALIDYITETLGGNIGEGYENPYGQGRITAVNAGS
ncbi:MAG: bifunctional metallophosphatase/5'-nucleotidase [Oscillospiraceae bacterium]|nr:bifunctional metallophosphatase/5'-nucleotidase [Oscillospiraceae bacterium]